MKHHPDKKAFETLCNAYATNRVVRCYISATQTGTGPGGNDKFYLSMKFDDKGMEYVYFSQRFHAQEWLERFAGQMKQRNKNAVTGESWAAEEW